MKLFKKYGILAFWAVLLMDLLLLNYGFNSYRQYTSLVIIPTLMAIFWAGTRRSKHYTKKIIVYITLLFFGVAYYFLYKSSINNPLEFFKMFYVAEGLAILGLIYLFFGMQPLNFKDAPWALLGFVLAAIACFVSYKIIQFAQGNTVSSIVISIMLLMCILQIFAFNVYENKQKKKLAIEGFMPGSILILVSLLILLGYWLVVYGEDTKVMLMASILCNAFGLSLITQNLVKYLKG